MGEQLERNNMCSCDKRAGFEQNSLYVDWDTRTAEWVAGTVMIRLQVLSDFFPLCILDESATIECWCRGLWRHDKYRLDNYQNCHRLLWKTVRRQWFVCGACQRAVQAFWKQLPEAECILAWFEQFQLLPPPLRRLVRDYYVE